MRLLTATQAVGENLYSVTHLLRLPGNYVAVGQADYENVKLLPVNVGTFFKEQSEDLMVRAQYLVSCASLCIVSPTGKAYVYHANAGSVTNAKIQDILDDMGQVTIGDLFVVLAHPNVSDQGYHETVTNLITMSFDANKIIEIQNLALPSFGLTNYLQVSY